jgi:hypothetical protein
MSSSVGGTVSFLRKKRKYNPLCEEDNESLCRIVQEDCDIDTDDEFDLESDVESASEESRDESSESDCKSGSSVAGWRQVTKDSKPSAYTFSKNAGPQCNLPPDAEPMDYFSLFFDDTLLRNIVTGTNRYARDKILKIQLNPKSIWNKWHEVSVPEMKAFLGLIINMGLIPLPEIKDY